ncbi:MULTISPECIES: DUF3618 domain-containing protein [Sphingomonas]|nr:MULTISPECIES: DUF3618 domain-containing protein [Sphingomonas]MCW6529688.1 DUF3618 domain-containing protein [Sphingomonas lycopersici]OJU20042.1 MAG: hypothetical protein BGN95_21730 [Sphingomonas sp. 66-10]
MTDMTELDRAEARAALARLHMAKTLTALQTRLDPRNVAREAVDGLADTGTRVLDAGIGAAKRHPGKIAGGVALLAAFLGRHHIAKLIGKARSAKSSGKNPLKAERKKL